MGIQDTSKLLQRMGMAYPDRVHSEELSREMGFEGVRAVRAVRGLVEAGLITAHGSPGVDGMPGSELMLTENGMAVAFGLALAEADPRGAILTLEAQTVRQLRQDACDETIASRGTDREFGNVGRRRCIQRTRAKK